jgi:hypothetical protein
MMTDAALAGGKPRYLKHYTRRCCLNSILESEVLWLADPTKWKDKNDQASVRAFSRLSGDDARQVRVLCLTEGDELIHHWNAYAGGPDGCRIDLDTEAFLERAEALGLIHDWVDYCPHNLDAASLPVAKLPFVKRAPYRSDHEYRVIWAGPEGASPPEIPINDLVCSITLSYALPEADARMEKDRIAALAAKTNFNVTVHQSALWEYQNWINIFDKL